MVDGIKVMRSLWTQNPASYAGEYYTVRDAFSTPQPDPVPPILIGGEGERYLLRAVAEHADIWLPHTKKIDVLKHKISVLERHCDEAGRDISEIRIAHTIPVFLDTSRSAAREWAGDRLSMPDPPFAGTPEELWDYLNQYIELGVTMFHMVFPGFPRTHDMELFAAEVLPRFAR
jgi:alkanesulfonate monooxygenase SsuD/methylene tetrahydromethanopterin reductase-like flavin-dependent oxidoreductase (luciferase family)